MSTTEAAHLAATTSTQICRKCDSLFHYSSIAGADNPENKTAGPSKFCKILAKLAKFAKFAKICKKNQQKFQQCLTKKLRLENEFQNGAKECIV